MSEIAARETGALARPSDEFVERFPALDDSGEDLMDLLAENLGGDGDVQLSIGDFIRVKVPSGGSTLWSLPDPETGEETALKTITGVIVTRAERRSFWEADEPNGSPPDCRSNDLKIGEGMYGIGSEANPTGSCKACPMSQRGSAGTGTQASKCKQQALLFLLPPGELLPYMVSVPPGSLGVLRKFMLQQVSLRRLDYRQVEVTLGLEKVKGEGTPDYARVTFAKGVKLGASEHAAVRAFGEKLADLIKAQATEFDKLADGVTDDDGGPVVDAEPVDYEPGELPEDEVDVSGRAGR